MPTTTAELVLSPACRQARRILASRLDQNDRAARQGAFAAQASPDVVERNRLIRWPAWLRVTAMGSRRTSLLAARIRRLNVSLYSSAMDHAMLVLPLAEGGRQASRAQRLVA